VKCPRVNLWIPVSEKCRFFEGKGYHKETWTFYCFGEEEETFEITVSSFVYCAYSMGVRK